MAHSIIIGWGAQQLSLASVRVDGNRVSVQFSGVLSWDESANQRPVAEAAAELRTWLGGMGVGNDSVTIVLPRESVVLRRLDLPDAPDDELPDLVRFQAATKASTPIDDLALDFLPLPASPGVTGRTAVAVTVDRSRLQRIEATVKAAGLTPARVTLSTIAAARYLQGVHLRGQTLQSPALLLHFLTDRLEISVFESGNLVFSHGVRLPEGDPAKTNQLLRTELNRTSVALSQMHQSPEISHCYVLASGPLDDSIIDALQERYVQRLTVIGEEIVPAEYRGLESLIGAALEVSRTVPDVDLLHPRKRAVKPDRRKLYWSVGGGLAALVLGGMYMMFRSQVTDYDDRIFVLNEQYEKLQAELTQGAPRLAYHTTLANWKQSQADVLDQLRFLASHISSTERLYLENVTVAPQGGDLVATVKGKIHARSQEDINDLLKNLGDAGHRASPPKFEPGAVDPDYPVASDLTVDFMRPKPPKTQTAGRTAPVAPKS